MAPRLPVRMPASMVASSSSCSCTTRDDQRAQESSGEQGVVAMENIYRTLLSATCQQEQAIATCFMSAVQLSNFESRNGSLTSEPARVRGAPLLFVRRVTVLTSWRSLIRSFQYPQLSAISSDPQAPSVGSELLNFLATHTLGPNGTWLRCKE